MTRPLVALSSIVTLTASAMTAVAAWDRGGTTLDKLLLVTLSVVIILAVHLLPAMSKRPVTWLVWAGCLLCAIYGHLTFLTHASLRAADNLAQRSSLAVGTERQIATTREALDGIRARPVATVAAELAQSNDRRERAALREEIAEGRRAEALRDELVRLSGVSTTAQVSGAADPVTARLAQVTGWTESAVAVAIGLTFSILLELIGALLWYEALRHGKGELPGSSEHTTQTDQPVTQASNDPVTVLQQAIDSGKCRATVASIRVYLNCSQTRAMELRRELASVQIKS